MADAQKIYILGVGNDGVAGLTSRARDLLQSADLIVGSDHALNRVAEIGVEQHRVGSDLQDMIRVVESQTGQRLVIVASGDPLFYGVARYLCDRLGKDRFEVLPHVSSMQLAFARIKESWEEAFLSNLVNHPLATVVDRIRVAETVGLFTSEAEGPAVVARVLLARGIDYFKAYVCENLGGPDERVTPGELSEIQDMEFAPLNVMILKRKPGRPDLQRPAARLRRFGNPDDVFAQSRPKSGLITQAEVRSIVLAQLHIQPGSVVWDVGAGSGSVAIEAAQLADPGKVYAIEQDAADYHLIVSNAQAFAAANVVPIHGIAPEVFEGLPMPDGIFIGGTGHEVARLLQRAYSALRPGGPLVVHVATIEALGSTYETLKRLAPPVHLLLVNLARGTEQFETLRFEALNPSFVLRVQKPENKR